MEIDKCLHRDVRGSNFHRRTSRQIKHPCRHDDRSARFSFDYRHLNPGAILTVKVPYPATIEGMPPVMDLYFLPDMGRITLRLLLADARGSSPVRIAAGSEPRPCML